VCALLHARGPDASQTSLWVSDCNAGRSGGAFRRSTAVTFGSTYVAFQPKRYLPSCAISIEQRRREISNSVGELIGVAAESGREFGCFCGQFLFINSDELPPADHRTAIDEHRLNSTT
jgi:hypothetical protein